jgi:phosphate transport system protein
MNLSEAVQPFGGMKRWTLRDEPALVSHTPRGMQRGIETELDALKQRLLVMASHAEGAVNRAVQALVNRDHDLASQVKDDDAILDRFEVELDELAIALLAKAPRASDLRLVTTAMKISKDLERVGDEAAKVAKRARALSQEPPVKVNVDLPRMATSALAMLKAALDAFVNQDAPAARAVIPCDASVDALNKEIRGQLIAFMTENPDTIARCLDLLTATKCLERIADHATNIAEDVVFLCEARDIRHRGNGAAPAAV